MPPHGRPTFEALAELFSRHRGDRRVSLELDVQAAAARPLRVRADVGAARPAVRDAGRGSGADRAASGSVDAAMMSAADARVPMPELLEFEEPIGVLLKEIEALSMLPRRPSASGRSRSLRRRADVDPRRDLREPDAVAARAGRAPPEPAEHARLRRAAVHRLRRDPRRPPLRRRPRDHHRLRATTRAQPVAGRRAPEGRATPSRRSSATSATRGPRATARRCARCSWREKFSRPIIVFVDTPAAYPGHRVGGARRRRSDRRQPARDDAARRADHRHRLRRRRQRRRARHRDRRSRPDAGVRDLQRDPARGLRGDPVARRRTGRSRPPTRSSSPRPTCCALGIDRRDHPGADRRRAHRLRRGDRAASTRRCRRALARSAGARPSHERLERALRRSSAAWATKAARSSTQRRGPREADG